MISLGKLRLGLTKTRESLVKKIGGLVGLHKKLDRELLDDLEEILLKADVGVTGTAKIIEAMESLSQKEKVSDPEIVMSFLKQEIKSILLSASPENNPAELSTTPWVIMVVGVNGTGKTTSIAKLARMYLEQKKKVLLAACDTFRAAAVDQLDIWAKRVGVDMVKSQPFQDPASVAFDALKSAKARETDIVIADTAGRLHTKYNLMEELIKIKRVMGKSLPGAPHEVLLAIDATTGQNAISQAKIFKEAVGVTGIILAKLDGTAKGGIVLAIASDLKIPVKYVGLGEKSEDLETFDSESFVEALFQ
ncbi:MAG: signal recognition particle-docking protein FtsY [Candidatus Zixiibacteriota bacterium]